MECFHLCGNCSTLGTCVDPCDCMLYVYMCACGGPKMMQGALLVFYLTYKAESLNQTQSSLIWLAPVCSEAGKPPCQPSMSVCSGESWATQHAYTAKPLSHIPNIVLIILDVPCQPSQPVTDSSGHSVLPECLHVNSLSLFTSDT